MEPPDAATSPQASAEPAPLANVPPTQGAATAASAGAEALRGDRELPPDTPHEPARDPAGKEPRDAKELAGYELQVVVRTGEGPPAPKGAEVSPAALDAARRKTEARMTVDLSQTRARFVMTGGFVLPPGTELRARVDRYGHVLMLPGEGSYRIAEPGAGRALLGERRLDVAPVSPVEEGGGGDGARRLGTRTRRVEIATRAARASLELGAFRDAGEGGALVCRLLLDLLGAPPAATPCAVDEIPLHAELRWSTQGAMVVDVTSVTRRLDLAPQDLATPPAGLVMAGGPPPSSGGEPLLGRAELSALRTVPTEAPPTSTRPDGAPPPPESGLLLVNSTDALRVAWLDGVPVAWVAPGGGVPLPSLLRGRYTLQWRSFLGDAWDAPQGVAAPGRYELGGADGPPR